MAANDYRLRGKFISKILPVVLEAKKLDLPATFVNLYGSELWLTAELILPNGAVWTVGVERGRNALGGLEVRFSQGWDSFLRYYSIMMGYSLRFDYLGGSKFSVKIFDLTTCQARYRAGLGAQHFVSDDVVDVDDGEDEDVVDVDDGDDEDVVDVDDGEDEDYVDGDDEDYVDMDDGEDEDVVVVDVDDEDADDEDYVDEDDEDYVDEDVVDVDDEDYVDIDDGDDEDVDDEDYVDIDDGENEDHDDVGDGEDEDHDDDDDDDDDDDVDGEDEDHDDVVDEPNGREIQDLLKLAKANKIAISLRLPTTFPRHKSHLLRKAVEGALHSEHPSFLIVMSDLHSKVTIPCQFARQHKLVRGGVVAELQANGGTWRVCLGVTTRDSLTLSTGWVRFYKDNGLRGGDVCLFELLLSKVDRLAVIKVSVFRDEQ